MADNDRIGENAEIIISEFHGIFDEQNVDKDLSAIKRIKKIVSDSHQIVKNREDEIKDVVRGEFILTHNSCQQLSSLFFFHLI